ncbi:MAG: glycosyltransferase family 1 protein [Acidimicrobiales bacterium]
MSRVHWLAMATSSPMGQQHYESKIQEAMRRVADGQWSFSTSTTASLRSPVEADVRFPMRLLDTMPVSLAALAAAVKYPRADLVHRFDLRVPPGQLPEVVTAHDLPPKRFDDEGRLPRYAIASARRAAGAICPSQFAADEIRTLCGVKRIWVIPYGLSAEFQGIRALGEAERAALGVRGRYVVHAAGVSERKNLTGLAEAWRTLSNLVDDVTLVLCGPPHPRRNELFAGLPRVTMPGRLSSSTVAGLMADAAAVVVPSTYEGFGLPALEGMAAGAPVVAANRGALPEVCGNAAQLVEPTGDGIAEGLSVVLSDSTEAARLVSLGRERARGFDWDVAARAHIDVYRELLE